MRSTRNGIRLMPALLLAPVFGLAGEIPADLGTVTVVATKAERAEGTVAGTVVVIDDGRIDETLARDLKSLFRYEPGISVSNDPNRFGLQDVTLRGVGGNRVALELDGVELPQAFSVGSFANAGRDYLDPELLRRVEVLFGPASTLYGSDALGGVVAYATKEPEDLLLGRRYAVRVKSGASSADESWQGTFAGAAHAGPFSALAAFVRREGHETDIAGAEANPQDYTDQSVLTKLVWEAADGGRTKLGFDYSSSTVATDVRSQIGAPGKFASTTSLLADDDYERRTWQLEHEREPSGWGAERFRGRLYVQRASTAQRTEQRLAADRGGPDPSLRMRWFDYEEDVAGAELLMASHADLRGMRHHFVYGADWSATRIAERRDGWEEDLVTGAMTGTIVGEILPVRDFPRTDVLELGLFLQDEVRRDGGRLTLIPGLRYDYYDLEPDLDAMYREDNPDLASAASDEHSLSPKLGLLCELGRGWTLYSQYAHGFRAPPAEDVNIGFTIPAFNFRALPNPDLEPERSDGIEAGIRRLGASWSLRLTGYYNRYRDLIESRVNLGVDPVSGVLVFQSLNRDRATIWGVEYRAHAELGNWWPILQGLSIHTGAAYSRGEDDGSGEPLQSVNPPEAVLGLTYTSPAGRWALELVGTFVARQDRVDESRGEVFETPGYATIDLMGRFDIGVRTRLYAGLANLTNKTYWQWADVRGLPADYHALDLYAAPGQSVSASLVVTF